MAERSLKVAVMKAARNMGTAAKKEAVRQAAEAVVAETMQVGDMEEALAEIEDPDAVQAVGWAAAELVIRNGNHERGTGGAAGRGGVNGVRGSGPRCGVGGNP